jgi:hypothetical protein
MVDATAMDAMAVDPADPTSSVVDLANPAVDLVGLAMAASHPR